MNVIRFSFAAAFEMEYLTFYTVNKNDQKPMGA